MKLCAFRWLISRPQVLTLRSPNQIRGKLLLSRKLWHSRGSRFSQCFITSTSSHYSSPSVVYANNYFEKLPIVSTTFKFAHHLFFNNGWPCHTLRVKLKHSFSCVALNFWWTRCLCVLYAKCTNLFILMKCSVTEGQSLQWMSPYCFCYLMYGTFCFDHIIHYYLYVWLYSSEAFILQQFGCSNTGGLPPLVATPMCTNLVFIISLFTYL